MKFLKNLVRTPPTAPPHMGADLVAEQSNTSTFHEAFPFPNKEGERTKNSSNEDSFSHTSTENDETTINDNPAILLVIDTENKITHKKSWEELFDGYFLCNGRGIKVIVARWDQLLVQFDATANISKGTSSGPSALVQVCNDQLSSSASAGSGIATAIDATSMFPTTQPDFVLIQQSLPSMYALSSRNALLGLLIAQVPSINSLESIHTFSEQPLVQSELYKIQQRVGTEAFPVLGQQFFSSYANMTYMYRQFPSVVKVGCPNSSSSQECSNTAKVSTTAKLCVTTVDEWEDVRSFVAALNGMYCTSEPFIDVAFDIRIQKIGRDYYRAYRFPGRWRTDLLKVSTTSSGLSNRPVTSEDISPIPMHYKRWVDEASKSFGGLDLCTLDVIQESGTGKEYILNMHATSSNIVLPRHVDEDNCLIRDLVLEKMNQKLGLSIGRP